MTRSDIIDSVRDLVIQIATPYSTGTGFYLKSANLIITNEHVIRENKRVVIKGKDIPKQICDVVYMDPRYDLAFLAPPKDVELDEPHFLEDGVLSEGDVVIAVGHPFGLNYTATEGILSNLRHEQDGINYIQHDAALNPGNSGGPLLNLDGKIIGVNTFIIKDGNNIGFSLPVHYLRSTLETFLANGIQEAVRCTSCLNIIFNDNIQNGYCQHCGSKVLKISDIEPYEPVGVNKTIEKMLVDADYDIDLSRRGPNQWQIKKGSAIINISYHVKSGLIIGDAYLCLLPSTDIKPIYTYLLKENYKLEGLTLSVKGQDIILSLLIYDQYLNIDSAKKLFNHLFAAADDYDNVLVEEYGAVWKKEL